MLTLVHPAQKWQENAHPSMRDEALQHLLIASENRGTA